MAAPSYSPTVAVCAVLGPAVGCLGMVSLSVDLALNPPRSSLVARQSLHLTPFFLPSIPSCSSSHLAVALSSLSCRRSLLSFLFLALSASRIRLSLFQGRPPRSFSTDCCFPFPLQRSFTLTPFGTSSTRAHPRESTVHSFTAQASQNLHYQYTIPTKLDAQICTEICSILHPLSPVLPTFTHRTPNRLRAICATCL